MGRIGNWLGNALPWLLLAIALSLVFSQVSRPALLLRVWAPWAEIGTLALALTAIILTAGIDLSVGAIVALASIVLGALWQLGCPWVVAVGGALGTGLLCGCLNGTIVACGVSPLVATLATMALFRGLAMLIAGTERMAGFPAALTSWRTTGGVPSQFLLLAAAGLLFYLLVHHLPFGRCLYAMGENRVAAEFSAIPVRRMEWRLYALSGLVAGLVAVFYTVARDAAVPDAMRGAELQAIACVVVGGTAITGGRGGIPRTLLGLMVVANLDIGLQFLSTRFEFLTAESRLVVIGILLIAVATWNEAKRPTD